MGTRLLETFAQEGLEPCPNRETEFAVVVGEDAISRTVDFVRSLLPAILGAGIATEEEVRHQTRSPSVCVPAPAQPDGSEAGPTAIGAFATKPSEL